MDYKTILVHLDAGPRRTERLELALALADRHDAHLVGLFALSAASMPSYIGTDASAMLKVAQERRRVDAAAEAETQFRAAAARYGAVKAEWRVSSADAAAAVRLNARYSDLVVAGQREAGTEERTGIATDFVEEVILSCGRPVLLVPYAGRFREPGKTALVAWNASTEAARAVADALPLLKHAERVEVVVFEDRSAADHGENPGADAALYLARHGVKSTMSHYGLVDLDVGSQILNRASDISVDFIVMGAYGHSRLRELVLGGVTRTLLESMTVPVLMSR
jgi:nucleotide-binding universal stress UspA family protein